MTEELPPETSKPLLEVSALRFTLPGQKTPLFDGIDLRVDPGETVVIMGGSGTGKSTLAELMFGLRADFHYDGDLRLDRHGAALLLQSGAVFEHLSIGGNLSLVLRRFGKPHGPEAITNALAQVKLDHHPPGRRADTLSGGEQRRLALARALCADPDFLFFDEPSAGLDLDNVYRQGRLIRDVVRRGTGSRRSEFEAPRTPRRNGAKAREGRIPGCIQPTKNAGTVDGSAAECRSHSGVSQKGAVVVTHDSLLGALVADRVLLLTDGRLEELAAWPESPDTLSVDEEQRRLKSLEQSVLGRFKPRAGERTEVPGLVPRLLGALNPLAIGDYAREGLRALASLPGSARHFRDFASIFWRSFRLAGLGGVPFFTLIGAILGATFIMIILGASILPARITLDKVQAVPLTAITAPLVGFLFAARSGSALASWLGGMTYSRQVDALRTLAIGPDKYLRAPVWLGMVLAYALSSVVFFCAMWVGAYVLCRVKVGIGDPLPYLKPFGNAQITTQALMKIPLYAVVAATVTTRIGLMPKPTSESVARGITRVIIVCSVVVALTELMFAGLLALGGGG